MKFLKPSQNYNLASVLHKEVLDREITHFGDF